MLRRCFLTVVFAVAIAPVVKADFFDDWSLLVNEPNGQIYDEQIRHDNATKWHEGSVTLDADGNWVTEDGFLEYLPAMITMEQQGIIPATPVLMLGQLLGDVTNDLPTIQLQIDNAEANAGNAMAQALLGNSMMADIYLSQAQAEIAAAKTQMDELRAKQDTIWGIYDAHGLWLDDYPLNDQN